MGNADQYEISGIRPEPPTPLQYVVGFSDQGIEEMTPEAFATAGVLGMQNEDFDPVRYLNGYREYLELIPPSAISDADRKFCEVNLYGYLDLAFIKITEASERAFESAGPNGDPDIEGKEDAHRVWKAAYDVIKLGNKTLQPGRQ